MHHCKDHRVLCGVKALLLVVLALALFALGVMAFMAAANPTSTLLQSVANVAGVGTPSVQAQQWKNGFAGTALVAGAALLLAMGVGKVVGMRDSTRSTRRASLFDSSTSADV